MTSTVQTSERAGKGCGIFFFGIFALVGIVGTVIFARSVWNETRTRLWEATPCTIVHSELKEAKKGTRILELSYLYAFRARNYTGTQLKPSGNSFDDLTKAQRAARQYRSDQRATCYVNPSEPHESVLELTSPWFAVSVLFPLIFAAIGVSGIVWLWRGKSSSARPLSERAKQTGGGTALRIAGIFFALIGGLFTYLMWLRPWLDTRASTNWIEKPCVIRSSGLKTHSGGDGGPTYSIDITYAYVIDGEEFIGTRYDFTNSTSSSRGWRKRVVDAYPPGRKTVCYVNPDDPLDSVLLREMSSDAWFGLLGGVFVLVGVGLFIGGGVAKQRAKSSGARTPLSGAEVRDFHGSVGNVVPVPGGPTTLKPAASPLASFIVLLVIGLFWNGLIWGILLATNPPTAAKVFLSIFVLIGLGLLAAAVHQFLALFNPRPSLQANASAVRLGETLDLRFSFSGRVQRITRLTVTLQGEEVATYRRGTDTKTDRHIFRQSRLLDTTDKTCIQSGTVTLTIPADSMHSFDAPNNKIEWKIELHGEIPRWPDVKLQFPITVHPLATSAPV
jgi:hypothetical protein